MLCNLFYSSCLLISKHEVFFFLLFWLFEKKYLHAISIMHITIMQAVCILVLFSKFIINLFVAKQKMWCILASIWRNVVSQFLLLFLLFAKEQICCRVFFFTLCMCVYITDNTSIWLSERFAFIHSFWWPTNGRAGNKNMRSALIVSNGTPRARCVCAYRTRCSKSLLLAARMHRLYAPYLQKYARCY